MGEAGSGMGPVRDRWPRASVAAAVLGLIVLAAGCQALRDGLAPHLPFPSEPSQACGLVLNPPGLRSPAPKTDWHVGVEIDRPGGSAILFASGPDTLLCFVERSANGSLGGTDTGGGIRDTGPGLTLDQMMGSPKAPMQDIFGGRIPIGTTVVRVVTANGADDSAAVVNGYYLVWLAVPALPLEIDALDAAGHLLQRLADPIRPEPS
jgi:hypothetical protein